MGSTMGSEPMRLTTGSTFRTHLIIHFSLGLHLKHMLGLGCVEWCCWVSGLSNGLMVNCFTKSIHTS